MWRRITLSLRSLAASSSKPSGSPVLPTSSLSRKADGNLLRRVVASSSFSPFSSLGSSSSSASSSHPFGSSPAVFAHRTTSDAENILAKGKKQVEDIMPIATGHEREELEAELEGKKRFDMDAPTGPFGTKDAPAIVQSYYNKRIVGCPGGEGEDEHDVVWFWLEKDKTVECPVCSQYFKVNQAISLR